MNVSAHAELPIHQIIGLIVVILLHLLMLYVLVTGLSHSDTKIVPAPIEMQIIQEIKPPEPIAEPVVAPKPVLQQPQKITPKPKAIEPKPLEKTIQPSPEISVAETPTEPVKAVTPAQMTQPQAEPAKATGETRGVSGSASANCPTPSYPQEALMNEEQGRVRILLDVGANGRVTQAKVTKSSGSRHLDRAVRSAYQQCVFSAALQNGVAVAGSINLDYEYKLD